MLDEVRVDLYFINWFASRSSGRRLDLYFMDWLAIWSSQCLFSSVLTNRICLFLLTFWNISSLVQLEDAETQDMQGSSSEMAIPALFYYDSIHVIFHSCVMLKPAFAASHEVDTSSAI